MPRIRKVGLKWLTILLLLGVCFGMALGGRIYNSAEIAHAAPAGSYAPLSVIISEVAWSGTAASGNDEWIELYNPGTENIDLTGWMLVTDIIAPSTPPNLSITITACTGSCIIPAGGFFLLERYEWATDVSSDLTYTLSGQLSVDGEVLRLRAEDGTEVDTANLGLGNPNGWYAGSKATFDSMERVNVIPDAPGAWVSNDGTKKANGEDRDGNPVNGTPGQLNSVWNQLAPAAPILDSPDTIITDHQPTYTWFAVSGATVFRIEVYPVGSAIPIIQTDVPPQVCSAGICSYHPATMLPDGNYQFWVLAKNIAGSSAWSAWNFFVVTTPTATTTPTRTPTPSRTPTRTRTPTLGPTSLPGIPVINEILPHPRTDWNADGTANYGDEYIEIINIDTRPANMKGWKLRDSMGTDTYTLPDITLQPRQIIRLYGSDTGISLSDGGDGVRLIRPTGQIVDAFDYPLVEAADRTWCRLPDGNGAWVFGCWPTPGRPNTRSRAGEPLPSVSTVSCPLADTVPMSIQLAECGSAGDAIWNSGLWKIGEFWLRNSGKWGVFIE